jgi:hypothetical protein
MSETKTTVLIQRLHRRTADGTIAWEKAVDEAVFRATFGSTSVAILPEQTSDGWGGYRDSTVLRIYNDEGVLIEEISSDNVGQRALSEMMQSTYELARRQAMGVDKILDSLLKELEPS